MTCLAGSFILIPDVGVVFEAIMSVSYSYVDVTKKIQCVDVRCEKN